MEKFSEILKELKEEKGISWDQIAKESGVAKTLYFNYLKGSFPSIKVAERIANYFDCSLDYLFGLDEVRKRGTYQHFDMSVFLGRYDKVLKENKVTHWKFCQEFHLSESNIRKWRKGQNPSAEILIVIARELSTSIDWLIGRK